MFSQEVLHSRRVRNIARIESATLIFDYHGQLFAQFASAINANQLARIETVAMKHRIIESLTKGELNRKFLACNAARFFD
jgi:hypothetical protein